MQIDWVGFPCWNQAKRRNTSGERATEMIREKGGEGEAANMVEAPQYAAAAQGAAAELTNAGRGVLNRSRERSGVEQTARMGIRFARSVKSTVRAAG
jgi:hypothetical protein